MVDALQLVDLNAETCMSDETVPFQKWRSTWDGTRRRYRTQMPSAKGNGVFSDQLFEAGKHKQLTGRDPSKPASIQLGMTGGMVGVISEEMSAVSADKTQCYLMHRFRLLLNDKDRSLPELLSVAPSPPTCEPTVLENRPVLKLEIPHMGMADATSGTLSYQGSKLVAYLDPARNFAACRVDCQIAADAALKTPAATQRIESIGEWQEFDGGWIPLKTRIVVEMPGKQVSRHVVFTVNLRGVNRPLPKDAFDFQFPENLVVGEIDASGRSRETIHLIGQNGEIARTFANHAELDQYGESIGLGLRKPVSIWPRVFSWTAVVCVIGVVGLVFWRWWRIRYR